MAKNAVFKKLAEIADVNTLTQEEHEKYDSSIKVLRDNIAVYQGAIQKGIRKERRCSEKAMKDDGLPAEVITIYTGLSAEGIANL